MAAYGEEAKKGKTLPPYNPLHNLNISFPGDSECDTDARGKAHQDADQHCPLLKPLAATVRISIFTKI